MIGEIMGEIDEAYKCAVPGCKHKKVPGLIYCYHCLGDGGYCKEQISEVRKEVARDILIALKYVLKEPPEDKYSRDRDIDVVLEFFSRKYHVKVD